jgi:hypothetical protein
MTSCRARLVPEAPYGRMVQIPGRDWIGHRLLTAYYGLLPSYYLPSYYGVPTPPEPAA